MLASRAARVMPIRQEGSVEAGYGIDEMAAGGGLLGLIPWYPIAAEPPLFLSRQSAWVGHIPFAFWSVAALRPDVFVELGTMAGDSYLAFCQAIEALSLPTCAHAVDHWKGDEQAGFYGDQLYEEFKRRHDGHYSRFSSLLRMDFDEAASLFPEESIDLLHIDGCHRYEVVRKDFFRWLPKLSRRAVVLLHDVAEWRSDFGVWRLWNELRAGYPSFLFPHAHGLGVILAGPEAPEAFQALASLSGERAARVRRWFRRLGERVAADPRAGEEPKGGGGLPGERQVQDAVLEEPAAILEKMRRDPVWRFLGWTRLRSQRSGQLLTQACALARELSEEGLSNASRRSILEDLTEAAERHLRSRSFRTLARFGAIFRPLRREKAEEEGERLRDALWRSFRLLVRAIGAEEALPWRDSLGFPLERDADKMALRERYRKALEEFLLGSDRLPLPSASEPELSVVVVLYNQAELTYACLRSLAIHLDPAAEVILVDNASTDRTGELLARIEGARILRNSENLHFLRGANQGAAAARGRLLLFLNSDAQVVPETIEAARRTLEGDPSVGAVGARIVNLDGQLQEAGSFIWGDGSPEGHGRGDHPLRRDYLFRREIDYGSGAFLLTDASLFREMGGFDEVFAPAYFEESDYCLRLWERGKRVIYEPDAVVLHWEFGSSGLGQATEWMVRNQKVFVERHSAFFRGRPMRQPGPLPRAVPRRAKAHVLYVDDRVPRPELGAGYPRANAILRELVAWGAQVTLFPMSETSEEWEEIYGSLPREVEVLREMDASLLESYLCLETRVADYDLAWISRPYNMARLCGADRAKSLLAGAPLVYDAEAIFALREIQTAKIRDGRPLPKERARALIAQEVAWARGADRVVAVSDEEAREFRRQGVGEVRVIGHALAPAPTAPSFEERKDFLLVGAVHGWKNPNGDALLWFAERVLPKLRGGMGEAPPRLIVAGYGTDSPELRQRLGLGVILVGPAADLTPYYERARVFLAPTRFAAGIPMKAHEAAARGLPMVTSELIARQLGWTSGEELLSAPVSDEAAFAEACRRLYTDRPLWERLRAGALASVSRDCDPKRFSRGIHELLDELLGKKKTGCRAKPCTAGA